MDSFAWFLLVLFGYYNSVAQVAIKAETIYTATGGKLINGILLVKDGRIEKLGTDIKIPEGYRIYSAKAVTPGLVDARSEVGFSGPLNISADQDQLEKSAPMQAGLRAIDAYNPDDKLVAYLRDNGVTTIHTGHGTGALISGQTMVVKTKPGMTDAVTLQPLAMVAMTIGPAVRSNFTSPGTKAKEISMLRTELLKTQEYVKKQQDKDLSKRPAADLDLEMLARLLRGEVKGIVEANKATDIFSALRLSKEFGFRLVLEGVAEAYRMIEEIKSSGAEVIVHPTMAGPGGDMVNMTMENAALLTQAGITVSIESGYEAYISKNSFVFF